MLRVAVLFACLCVFALAAVIYFAQSAATQSVPAYSTWNTDRDGARLLLEGLQHAGFDRVERQFKTIDAQKPIDATVLFLGEEAYELANEDDAYFNEMEACARRGNSLVIAVPDESNYTFDSEETKPESKDGKSQSGKDKLVLTTRWGVRFVSDKPLFHVAAIVDKTWQPMTDFDHVWQRKFGKGSITLVANGERLSNRSIAANSHNRKLLFQLARQRANVIFEEAHLGIRESGSIVGLARHYHLQGLMAGFLLLAIMFVWNHSVRFPPPARVPPKPLLVSDSHSVLTEMMSRHLRGQLISACIAEWNRSVGHRSPILSPEETNSVSAYRQIQEHLQNRSTSSL